MAQSVDRTVIACACGHDLLLWDHAKLVELADEVRTHTGFNQQH
jgi:hypothetical protein